MLCTEDVLDCGPLGPGMSGAPDDLRGAFERVRAASVALAAGLDPEDAAAQSMPDASPTKWHLAHTTWFFETFVLEPFEPGFRPHHPRFRDLFNSYYEAVGPRHPRPSRGLLTRPTFAEIASYRAAVDERMRALLAAGCSGDVAERVVLGLHHEQQHQELILTDLQHLFSLNPLEPTYRPPVDSPPAEVALSWRGHDGGLVSIGRAPGGDGAASFGFDNEGPRHRVFLEPFEIASRLVTNGEYRAFVEDGGYARPELWLSDGWAWVQAHGVRAPLYAESGASASPVHGALKAGTRFSLHGRVALEAHAPVAHVSFYEAEAFARWAKARLPTEAEWEVAAPPIAQGQLFEEGAPLVPIASGAFYGGAWVWTASPYVGYPGFAPAPGAVGEYNGKFMSGQMVLRGGSCFTPHGHVRATYRNFFPPGARWQVTGIRLARGASSSPRSEIG